MAFGPRSFKAKIQGHSIGSGFLNRTGSDIAQHLHLKCFEVVIARRGIMAMATGGHKAQIFSEFIAPDSLKHAR